MAEHISLVYEHNGFRAEATYDIDKRGGDYSIVFSGGLSKDGRPLSKDEIETVVEELGSDPLNLGRAIAVLITKTNQAIEEKAGKVLTKGEIN